MDVNDQYIWIFSGQNSNFPSAVFSSFELASDWIQERELSGMLSKYPIDISVYDWTIENKYFNPQYPSQKSATYIETFNSAYLEHYHYFNGVLSK